MNCSCGNMLNKENGSYYDPVSHNYFCADCAPNHAVEIPIYNIKVKQ